MQKIYSLLFVFAFCSVQPVFSASENMRKLVDESLDFSVRQSMRMYEELKDQKGLLPKTAEDGKLITCKPAWWTSGFFPGTLWYCYECNKDQNLMSAAEEMTQRLEGQKYTTDNHDVGFIINCSFGNGYRLTGNEAYREVIETTAKSLSTRFNPIIGCTRSWDNKRWQFPVIIDNMMNLELLTVASSLTGNNDFYKMAKSHADKTMLCHFRPGGSSFHVVDYDTLTGDVLSQVTFQGLNDSSTWSRGQAWGLYGYTMMYRQTGDKSYLDHAVKIGKFIMNHPWLPEDKIPYWDFDSPEIPKADRDASAGAIMASAYIELSTYVESDLAKQFLAIGEQQIKSLASPSYRAQDIGDNNNFILKHSTGFQKGKSEIDAPLSYADYYFVEALIRYRNLLNGLPVVDVKTAFSENPDRALWLSALDRIARPVLTNMAKGELKKNMPVESNTNIFKTRNNVTHLEALGRVIAGIAPWLELGPDNTPEGRLRSMYIDLSVKAISNGVNPDSPDYLNFTKGGQPLVDAAYLAQGLLRARTQLWDRLDKVTQQHVIKELKASRTIKPSENNWLLFSAMVEAALKEFDGKWEFDRITYAFDRFSQWYKGDGWYGDGPNLHLDYYNSLVIHPMMYEILTITEKHHLKVAIPYRLERERYSRYAEQQERLISPEGTYPMLGRSLSYRFGIFHALSDVAYRKMLPKSIKPAQVRSALTAVIDRQVNAPGTFNHDGWLNVGFVGHQHDIGETYISTGSLYMCSVAFIALGLPETDEFWADPYKDWTARKGWSGKAVMKYHALKN